MVRAGSEWPTVYRNIIVLRSGSNYPSLGPNFTKINAATFIYIFDTSVLFNSDKSLGNLLVPMWQYPLHNEIILKKKTKGIKPINFLKKT